MSESQQGGIGDRWDERVAQRRADADPQAEPTASARLGSSMKLATWMIAIGFVITLLSLPSGALAGITIGSGVVSVGVIWVLVTIGWGVVDLLGVAERSAR